MRFVGVIPARFHSTRLPGKPLIEIGGRPLIEWVYRCARRSARLEEVWVATDDRRIFEVVAGFGGLVLMTGEHASGTDRVAEAAASIAADVYINIQGDEPCIPAATIDRVCEPFLSDREVGVTTARVEIVDEHEAQNPHVNKVVVDFNNRALYFSRSRIPFPRRRPARCFKHVGIYGYRREVLLSLDRLKPSPLEEAEALEQLRLLENGVSIYVVEVEEDSIGVDTPEDLERVRPLLENGPH